MIPLVNTTGTSSSLKICLNTLILLSISRNDCLILSVNNDFKLAQPIFTLNVKYETELFDDTVPDLYLLDLDEIRLNNFLEEFYDRSFFNPRAKYLIVGTQIPAYASETLASKFVLNVVFLNKISETFFTFYPFSRRMLKQIDTRWFKIGNCNTLTSEDHCRTMVLFEEKIPKVWTNSTISVMHSTAPPYWICSECEKEGYDSDLHHLAFSHFNLTENLTLKKVFDEEWESENLKSLQKKQFDIILGEPPYLELDFTYPHIEYFWSLVVPIPEEMPRWKYILTLFSKQVWLLWAITCVSLYVVAILADVISERIKVESFFEKAALILKLSIGQPYNMFPKNLSEGFLFVSISFFTTIMAFIYTGRFPYFLVGINFERGINTLEDIVAEKLTIGTPRDEITKDYFSKSEMMKNYYDKYRMACDYSTDCLDQLIAGRNMTFLITTPQLNYWQQFYLNEMGRSKFKRLEPPYMKQQFGSILVKGHPLTKRLSQFLFHLDQHGIKKRIISEYEKQNVKQMENLQTKSLTIEYIDAPLFIWGLGVIFAVVVFIFEINNI